MASITSNNTGSDGSSKNEKQLEETDIKEFLNTNEKRPGSRLPALDIARLIAMLMMVQGHTVFCLMKDNVINSTLWYWQNWTIIRGLTAPVFLMVSGAVHVFANKRDHSRKLHSTTLHKRIKICLMLLFVGYLMQFPATNLYDLPFLSNANWMALFKVNVLQMFSASILFLTFLYVITRNNKQLAISALVIANVILVLAPFSLVIDWYGILSIPLSSFLSMKNGTIFPLLPFTAYLLFGTFVGYLIQRQPSENRTFYIATRLLLIGAIYIAISYVLKFWLYHGGLNTVVSITGVNINLTNIPASLNFLRVGLAMFAISISAWLCYFFEKMKSSNWQKFENIIGMFSKRSLFIYVIHLIIIYGSPFTPGLRHFLFHVDTMTAFYCAFFVIFATMLIVYVYEQTTKKEKFVQFYKYTIAALLIYMLFI